MSRALALAGSAAIFAIAAAGASSSSFPSFGPRCARSDFRSAGTTVRAELCRGGRSDGRAALVLHGCGGFSTFDHRLVSELPAQGVDTLDVDFFGPTPPPGHRGWCGDSGTGPDPFPVWLQVVRDAAAHLGTLPGVNPRRVAVVGWSLGGGLAVAAASSGVHFGAIAAFSTGSFGDVVARVKSFPPTILLSGGKTDAIPLAETLPLYHALRAAGVPSALYVFPHGSHGWPGEQGTLGIQHAAAFLRRYDTAH